MLKIGKIETISLVYAISFLDLFSIGLTFPLLSNHLRELGVSHTVIGLFSSTYSGVQVLSGPIIGGWSDVRDRKSVLKTTLLLCAICYGLLGVTNSIFIIFILRFILGTVKHTQSICKAVITDIVPPSEQTGVFGRSAAYGSFGFIIGPFIGGHLSELKHGFTYVSALTAVLFIVNLGISSFLPEDSTKNKRTQNISIISGVKQEFTKTVDELKRVDWKDHWDTFLLRFLYGLAVTCYFSNQSLYLKEKYEMSQRHIGYTISFFSTIGMLSAFFLDRINNLYKDDHTCFTRVYHFFFVMTLCFIGIYLSPNLWVLLILVVPISITSTALRVVSMELMITKSAKLHRGSLSGASNSIMSVARFIAPFLSGLVGDFSSEQSVMFVAVIPAMLGTIFSFYMRKSVIVHDKNK